MLYRATLADVRNFVGKFHEAVTPHANIFEPISGELPSPFPNSHFVHTSMYHGEPSDGGLHTCVGFYGSQNKIHSLVSPIRARTFDPHVDFADGPGVVCDHVVVLTSDEQVLGFSQDQESLEDYPFRQTFHVPNLNAARLMMEDPSFEPYREGIRFLVEFDDGVVAIPNIFQNSPKKHDHVNEILSLESLSPALADQEIKDVIKSIQEHLRNNGLPELDFNGVNEVRFCNVLANYGHIFKLGDLAGKSRSDLLEMKNFGHKMMRVLDNVLAAVKKYSSAL